MNLTVDKNRAEKKWAPILDALKVTDGDKRMWMSEYAELHQMSENVAYSTLGNLNGMGTITSPQPSLTPGSVWFNTDGTQGSGDIGQNLLPVSMKIAAQTIGLDLVAVKPSASPKIDLLFVDFKYDNNSWEADQAPLVFKISGGNDIAASNMTNLTTALNRHLSTLDIREKVGGLTERAFVGLSGATGGLTPYVWTSITGTPYTAPVIADLNTTDVTTLSTHGYSGRLEFLGFSRVDGLPMFRTFRQVTAPVNNSYIHADGTKNTFDLTMATTIAAVISGSCLCYASGATAATATMQKVDFSGCTIELVSLLEDQIPGFSAGWNLKTSMDRLQDERTYPGVIGPDVFTKSVAVGDIEITSALKRTQIEDIKASTGMDIVQKLESVLINELTQVISKQIVMKITEMAGLNRASHTTPKVGTVSKFDLDVDAYLAAGIAPGGETTHSIQRKLVAKVNNASNFIATDGRVGPAQYLVTNGNVASVLQDIAGYTINPTNVSKLNTNGQLYPMGNIGNIAIYVDPYMLWNDNRIFLGRKNSVDQPGIVFIPYLMAQSISLISEATWAPRMMIRSRYAITDIGFFPEKQYMEIRVTDTNGVLI